MYDLSRSSRYKSSYISYALNKAKATTALTHSINQFVVHFLLKIINGKIEGFETCADINAPAGPLAFLMLNFWIPRIPCNSLEPASGTLELHVTNCRTAAFSLRVRASKCSKTSKPFCVAWIRINIIVSITTHTLTREDI